MKKILLISCILLLVILLTKEKGSAVQKQNIHSTGAESDSIFIATELLGRPTNQSITINALARNDIEVYFEYGPEPSNYTNQTDVQQFPGGEPIEVVIDQLAPNALTTDGHCGFSPDRQWMLTDTYPDRNGVICLLAFHWGSGEVIKLGEFFSPPTLDDEVRCDLHPRWSADGLRVCVDSVDDGTRQIYELDLSAVIGN